MDSLVLAQDALDTAWQSAMRDAVPPDTHPSAERLQAKWMQLLHQTLPLNTAFNEAVEIYNAAIAQFPAWLLAKVGFRMAGSPTAGARIVESKSDHLHVPADAQTVPPLWRLLLPVA
jgi:hypothetical protein